MVIFFRNKQILCKNNEFLFDLKNISEELHIKFMKIVLDVHSKTCNLADRSDLGRSPLHIKFSHQFSVTGQVSMN